MIKRGVLHIQPISPQHRLELLGLALIVQVVMELHKVIHLRIAVRCGP